MASCAICDGKLLPESYEIELRCEHVYGCCASCALEWVMYGNRVWREHDGAVMAASDETGDLAVAE